MNSFIKLIKKYPVLIIISGFHLFRLALLPFMGLMPQDAYYHFYGEHLSWSYFDHPGMIGYILRLFTLVFGKSIIVVKLADFTITSLILLIFYKLSRCFLPVHRASKAILLITSTFFISILSFNSTPDVPLLLFWTISVLFLYKAVFEEKKLFWIYAGITMGLAFNSKYTALLLQSGLLVFPVFSKKYRKLLISPWLWLSIIISILITFPVWWWNYQHGFASFLFQSSDRTSSISEFQVTPKYFFGAIGHQIALLFPFLLGILITFTFKYIKRFVIHSKLPGNKILFLLVFFIPVFVGFFSLTPVYWVKLNWIMPSYITGIILASIFINRKMLQYQLIFSIIIHLLVSIQILFYIIPVKSDDTWVGWEELAHEVKNLQKKYPDTFIFSNDGYKTSAELNFFLKQKVYAQNIIGLSALHFDYLGDDLNTLNSKDALFVDSDKHFKNDQKLGYIPGELKNNFNKIKELEPIIIFLNDKPVRKFWIFYCTNYQYKK